MNFTKKEEIANYIRKQINNVDIVAKSYIQNNEGKNIPKRNIFVKLKKYVEDFFNGGENRWVVLTGLRGVGKTTMAMNLYSEHYKNGKANRLYISVDKITELLGVSLFDVLTVYEEMKEQSFEEMETPLLLFIDEAQYDPKWAITLKDIYDRAHNVFIFTTGSSALSLNLNSDTARRPMFEKLYPLTFTEYIKLKNGIYESAGLSSKIKDAIFNSVNAKEVFDKLKKLEPTIEKYLLKINNSEFQDYLLYGSLPSLLFLPDNIKKQERIYQSLNRIVTDDISKMNDFDNDTIKKIPMLLYNLAQMDVAPYTSFSKEPLSINRHTVKNIFDVLEKTETITKIPAYSPSHTKQSRISSKYVFSASAFRVSYFNTINSVTEEQHYYGKILEDIVALYLIKNVKTYQNHSLTYDAKEGGADYILSIGSKKIVIEVGYGTKDYRQVLNSSKYIKPNYSLVISRDDLHLSPNEKALKIPIKYFTLM